MVDRELEASLIDLLALSRWRCPSQPAGDGRQQQLERQYANTDSASKHRAYIMHIVNIGPIPCTL